MIEAIQNLPDIPAFLQMLNTLKENTSIPKATTLFSANDDVVVSRAPGRLDVMGGIADYSGSLVLQLPIREATTVALQRNPLRQLKIVSLQTDEMWSSNFEMPLTDFENLSGPIDYSSARAYFQRDKERSWAAYAAGVFLVLMRERGIDFKEGASIFISSNVPLGKGVSSSAAIEVAVMQAVITAFDIKINGREMSLLCQKVENFVVGAPCGVMDQMTSACGEAHHLLALLCQPAELQEIIQIPQEIEFWGLDSGVKHSVSGSDYTRVRAGTFMGYRIITELAGFNQKGTSTDDLYLGGYLSNLTPSEFEHQYARHLPESITGAEFLSRYQWTTDHVTTVEPLENYAVRVPTAHAIYEHFRVRTYAQLLKQLVNERQLELLGELMYQSHASYSACGLGSEGTDLLVKFVRDMGPARGLYGAKITGGGSGGTVVVLGHRNDIAVKAIQDIANRYDRKTKHYPHVFSGSSPGAVRFGCLKVRKDVVNP